MWTPNAFGLQQQAAVQAGTAPGFMGGINQHLGMSGMHGQGAAGQMVSTHIAMHPSHPMDRLQGSHMSSAVQDPCLRTSCSL